MISNKKFLRKPQGAYIFVGLFLSLSFLFISINPPKVLGASKQAQSACKRFAGEIKDTCLKEYDGATKDCSKEKGRKKQRECRSAYIRGLLGSKAVKGCNGPCKQAYDSGKAKSVSATASENASAFGDPNTKDQCGSGDSAVKTKFNFGCTGQGNGILDIAYSLIRFFSIGVGLIVVVSIIYAGIQYSSAEGNPEASMAAKKRVQDAMIALVFYLFIFALVQFLVPGGLFR